MKLNIFTFVIFFFLLTSLFAHDVIISGENTASYAYRTEDELVNNHFENIFNLRLDYRVFSFGMTFRAELPKFDRMNEIPISELSPNNIHTEWEERYAQLNFDTFRLKAGTIEESFGSGIVLRAWNDTELDRDRRLEGVQAAYNWNGLKISGVYGALRKDIQDLNVYENDLVVGADAEYRLLSFLNFGISAIEYRQRNIWPYNNSYTYHNVYGGRIGLMTDFFDLTAEYSELRRFHNIWDPTIGSAIYATTSIYLNNLTLGGGYKRYSRFDKYPLADLPTLNNYDELLMNYAHTDFEEGFMAEIRFIPSFDNEFLVYYSLSWDRDDLVSYTNIFTEYKHNLSGMLTKFDFEYLEKKTKIPELDDEIIDLLLKPSVNVNLYQMTIPLDFTFIWQYIEEAYIVAKKTYNKPFFQIEGRFTDNLTIAVFAENEFTRYQDVDKSRIHVGTSIATSIANHTDLTLFVGKEQGGRVCRNGVCQYQPPFEGVRLEVITRF
ncbi:MAG: DUF6029 family protein [Candidatus Cloacimonetes bacterium]|nr:DUF6029 family protein [Candidatus Cloacimonadota bacterium]